MAQQIEPTSNQNPVGAVLVVGGGIAGMQASLDLADQGFLVHLIETDSAIGGKMAQLDKTFPTNDCAMCTISPRLVETGRHPNIKISTLTDVLQVRGQVGNFEVDLRHRPRYIDPAKCVACNDCVEVCPVIVPDQFNQSLSNRRAVYKRYPQAIPNAYVIDKRGIAPCRDACPAGQRAQGYIALIREGRWEDALRVIKMDNPFPGICGRICNHRCESACNRALVDEPVNIRALKRFITDKVYEKPRRPLEPVPKIHAECVAIIGAGPCGLTAAQDLAAAGYRVSVFEAMPVAGGMLRLGVPEFRLPTEIIEREVQDILDLGVELHLNSTITDLEDLFDQGFGAVLIAVGAHEGIRLPIPGADLEGVLVNTHFLRDIRLGAYQPGSQKARQLGERILVLGGGNVAMDCARSAVRLGKKVEIACLEGIDEMPSHEWEVQAALDEGILIHNKRTFDEILSDPQGQITGVRCSWVESFSFDQTGRLHIEKAPNSQHVIACDSVIFSVGQRAGLAFLPEDTGVGLTAQQTVAIDSNTFAAARPGVFAAGDSVSGTAFVIEAVESGHRAASSIIRYLQGESLQPARKPELPVVRLDEGEIREKLARGEIHPKRRVAVKELPAELRVASFAEIEFGYDDDSAQEEAARCLACGVCSECMSCVFACQRDAIDHNGTAWEETVQVGAVILAPGYQTYQAELSEEFGLGRYPNVVTALQYERLLSASGPTLGHVRRPSDRQTPRRIAFLQCIGSRDQNHDYCSAVCCMYAAKESTITKEHHPEIDIHVFMMDMRAFSKGYWNYFKRSQDHYGVRYHRARISMLRQDPETQNLLLAYQDDDGERREDEFDLVVLSVGMEISPAVKDLGERLNIALDKYGFCHTPSFNPLETSREGIYAIGPFREPKDIPESVIDACAASAAASGCISGARFTLTTPVEYPPEVDHSQEEPRIGVFVCHCGSNIAGYLDVEEVTESARRLPYVTHAESNLYTCSQDNIEHISAQVKELGLNRVVVASCTPLTHQPLFQDSIRQAGLNPYLFEMANIRNQCSWVHSGDREAATHKACDLVRMAAGRAARLQPQSNIEVPVQPAVLVVGGGAAGMQAAVSVAGQGFPVHLVEKDTRLGGNLNHLYTAGGGRRPQDTLDRLIGQVQALDNIIVHTGSQVVESAGFMGNFITSIKNSRGRIEKIEHGAVILAVGGREYKGSHYGYGESSFVMTQLEFESFMHTKKIQAQTLKRVVMIQCIGPAEEYCSRICCSTAVKNAIAFKLSNPDAELTVLYKDIRTYGFNEKYYRQAREMGVIFMRYDDRQKPAVEVDPHTRRVTMQVYDPVLKRGFQMRPDLLVLSMPVVPRMDAKRLANIFKVPLDGSGFFLEAHVKLRPVDFSTNGVFMAGMAHYPKLSDESLVQAQAAASRALRVITQPAIKAGGRVAVVEPHMCTGCLTCVRICPFHVPQIDARLAGAGGIMGAAVIEAAVCQGCGICVAECPGHAIQLMHYTDVQMNAKIDALFRSDPEFIPLEDIVIDPQDL